MGEETEHGNKMGGEQNMGAEWKENRTCWRMREETWEQSERTEHGNRVEEQNMGTEWKGIVCINRKKVNTEKQRVQIMSTSCRIYANLIDSCACALARLYNQCLVVYRIYASYVI